MRKRLFGHRHIDPFYTHLFSIDQYSIEYKSRKYLWNDIEDIEILEPDERNGLTEVSTFERLQIVLKDGKTIRINSRVLVEKGKKPKIGYINLTNETYEELKKLLLSKTYYLRRKTA